MEKNISTQNLKSRMGAVIDEVRLRGNRFIIERRGEPVAALVPLTADDSYTSDREGLFRLMDKVAGKNRGIPSKQIDEAIEQSIREVRDRRNRERTRA